MRWVGEMIQVRSWTGTCTWREPPAAWTVNPEPLHQLAPLGGGIGQATLLCLVLGDVVGQLFHDDAGDGPVGRLGRGLGVSPESVAYADVALRGFASSVLGLPMAQLVSVGTL